ncbi:MAG: hypothetical protein HHJ15_16645 [Rhodoferax sp.]|uniref:hypothetical protein n=1 Tax=Rhodoferax sp. TaxID=50421 RepID=UPI0017E68869|nr:hypothetical protein [Rhodoferax sp.]NMM21557.1 hypothetical protein [Rhodoferax sp.]
MSELLAAIPRFFSLHRKNDYARFVQSAQAEQLTNRAVARTQRQIEDAYRTVIANAQKTNNSSSTAV